MSKQNIIKGLTAILCVAFLVFFIPKADHQSYSFEENQPWKYQLLTAEFDTPIMRDSASANRMRDSIDRLFVPFVKRDDKIAEANIKRFNQSLADILPASDRSMISSLLRDVYNRGIIDAETASGLKAREHKTLREMTSDAAANNAISIDASAMVSEAKAFRIIDSVYIARHPQNTRLSVEAIKSLNSCITPNILVDTVADNKFRSQEYLSVNAALGVIKKGQRIVDRGEIVTPQIFTNLNTYMEMLNNFHASTSNTALLIGSRTVYVAILILIFMIYIRVYRPNYFNDTRRLSFLLIYITLFVIFAIEMFEWIPNGLYIVPFAAIPVVILVFFDSRTAIFSLMIAVLLAALVATFPIHFIFTEFVVGTVATYSLHQLSKRSQLLRTAFITLVVYVICHVTINIMELGNLQEVLSARMITYYCINAVILSFAYVMIWVVEKVFGFTSTVTLVELSDINNPILRKLAEVAPGTFQHSMQVSTLAAEAARAINANTQLVRTGALYHDIGKMESPIFFTENQHGVSPHDGLSPEVSAKKIISHVSQGLEMAKNEKLPAVIRDFISQHHGKGMAKYFYNTAVNENPGKDIDAAPFTYPGPNPQTKETTILMMADSVEAASRSLTNYSKESISNLVDKIIAAQEADGLYKDSPLSFKEIQTIKDTFKSRLATIYHSRIAYPEAHKK